MHPTLATLVLSCALVVALPQSGLCQTPAEAKIRAAEERVDRALLPSERSAALVALAAAHTARGRETGDGDHYTRALDALARARETPPVPGDVAKIEAWVRLGRHEFADAEELARSHLDAHPEDPEAWGLLGDAQMELGRTEDALVSYQHMMNLKPGPGAFLRAAYYRERIGDLDGAASFLERALAATAAQESEQRAWILVLLASLDDQRGDADRAGSHLRRALDLFPGYHYALAALAEHHLAQGRPEQALPVARRALEVAPHAERWLTLADALRGVGRDDEARSAEDAFLRAALPNVDQPDNENLFLVDFYLDRRPDPQRALALARREAERRKDPATLERLARARAAAGVASPSDEASSDAGDVPDRHSSLRGACPVGCAHEEVSS